MRDRCAVRRSFELPSRRRISSSVTFCEREAVAFPAHFQLSEETHAQKDNGKRAVFMHESVDIPQCDIPEPYLCELHAIDGRAAVRSLRVTAFAREIVDAGASRFVNIHRNHRGAGIDEK